MKRLALTICALAGIALAADPYFGIRATQPTASGGLGPQSTFAAATVGMRFPRTRYIALNTELTGSYIPGAGDYNLSTWDASLRFGVELQGSPAADVYIMPGVMLTYASEMMPSYDTVSGIISNRPYSGMGLGLFCNVGVMLFRVGDWDFDVHGGLDINSVPTNWVPPNDPGFSSYPRYPIDLSGLSLGLVVRKGVAKAKPGRE